MRISCNGCRVLRKGCTDDCTIRPCLQWISNPDSQAHATLFLAKFYGRAGLINLINAGPQHLRPGIFRSLLYEACGRIVNPIYGSVGLLWSGNWNLCQAAVESVLKGAPINPVAAETAAQGQGPPLKAYDIRHVVKDENSAASADLGRVKTRCRGIKSKPRRIMGGNKEEETILINRSASHETSLSHSKESGSTVSVETAEAAGQRAESGGGLVGLELTLGLEPPSSGGSHVVVPVKKRRRGCEFTWEEEEEDEKKNKRTCKVDLVLELGAQQDLMGP